MWSFEESIADSSALGLTGHVPKAAWPMSPPTCLFVEKGWDLMMASPGKMHHGSEKMASNELHTN